MPVSEFYEGMIYERLEPFGGLRGDLHAGIIASTIANWSLGRAADSEPLRALDFMPKWDREPEAPKQQTAEQIFNTMKIIQTVQNAKIKANG